MAQDKYIQISGSLPPGGTTQQVLTKRSDFDGDADWEDGGSAGTVISVNGQTGNVNLTTGDIPAIGAFPYFLGNPNTFAGFDSSGVGESIPGFNIDTTSGGINAGLTEQPNNIGGGFEVHNWVASFEPLQNSPDDTWNIHNISVNLDNANSGFSMGTNGNAVQGINLTINNQNTGHSGRINMISTYANIGNGTDATTLVGGLNYANGFADINNNVTIDGQIQGYGFQPNVHSGVISTSNFGVISFYDFSNIAPVVHGYSILTGNPTITEIANNSNFEGISVNPTITTFTGNAGLTGVGIFGTIGTMSATGNMTGYTFSPNITTSHGGIGGLNISPHITGGDASFQGININPSGGYTTSQVTGININLNQINSSDPQGALGLSSDSRLSINASTQLMSAQGFQIGSRVEHEFLIPPGSPVTGTDCLGLDLAGDLSAQDNIAAGGSGLGFVSVGFIADMAVAATKTVDKVTAFLPAVALQDPGYTTGGTVTDMHMIRTVAPAPEGGTLNITNLYAFKLDTTFGPFSSAATNAYGIYLADGGIKNWFGGFTQIGGSSFTTPTHALEVNGAMVVSSNVGFFGVTAAAQQTGGAATATLVYTATEQAMLQKAYNALRTFGLLS